MKEYIINATPFETRISLLEDKRLVELTVERQEERSVVGNVYKGRIDAIVPGIQAAFVDIGLEKNGFLYVGDIAGAEGTGDFDFDEGENLSRSRTRSRRDRRVGIENILKKGQHIMVQVAKDTLGTKGVRLTNYVTLPGRYLVLMPTVKQGGVSRKIEDDSERDRLKGILRSVQRRRDFGLIVRTAGEGKTKGDFQADFRYLRRLWDRTKRKMERDGKVCLLHEDMGPILRIVRDTFTNDIDRLTIDSEEEYARITDFLQGFSPELKNRCKLYNARRPIFDRYGVEEEIEKALNRKVFLKSGGHICIDETEALIAIDVNTGKFTGKKRLEDTVFKTNLEAAEEIAHQVRLRDMGGIIVIDFIDMELVKHRKQLIQKLEQSLKPDRAKTTVSDVNELGLIEMTRKRVKHNLIRALSQPCAYCEGSGIVRSVTTITFDTLRRLESLFCKSKERKITLQVHPDVARRLRNENKELLDNVAKRFDRDIAVESVSDFHIHDIEILSARSRKPMTPGGR